MTLGFMGILSATIAERINARAAGLLLPLLVLAGALSVIYWYWTETVGEVICDPTMWYSLVPCWLFLPSWHFSVRNIRKRGVWWLRSFCMSLPSCLRALIQRSTPSVVW